MSTTATLRLKKEYKAIEKDPVPFITARPKDSNLLECHFVLDGPPNTPYHGGQYHGVLNFPENYPFLPPTIKMITPNGRFIPHASVCLSLSSDHPETWNPAWTISSILNAFLSFMTSEDPAAGAIYTSDEQKRSFAADSQKFNARNKDFKKIFADLIDNCALSKKLRLFHLFNS